MSSGGWQDQFEESEPGEAQAPPESASPVFGEVPGEAPTADLGSPSGRRASDGEPADPRQEPAEVQPAEQASQAPAQEPVAEDAVFATPEAVVSKAEEGDMSASEPAPEEIPLTGPDVDSVAADGHAPAAAPMPDAVTGGQAMWERPEVLLGAAFVGGLLLAALLRRRRS